MDEEEENDEEPKLMKITWKNPNPLFVKWISEWLEEARKRNMQLQYTLEKALESLKKFPLPLKSGKECLILEHFGTGLCQKLDRELGKYKLAKLETEAKPPAIPGPSTSGISRLPIKDPADFLEVPIKRGNKSTDENVTVPNDEQQSPKKLTQIDKHSPKKLSKIEITSKVRSTCVESVNIRSLEQAGQSATEINFAKQSIEKNVNLKPPADIDVASNVATTCAKNSTAKSRNQTIKSPDRRKHAEESPRKNAFSPKKSTTIGIANSVAASTFVKTVAFESKKQIIRTSPAKRKYTAPSPKKSPSKLHLPANPELFEDDNDLNTAPLSQLSSVGSCSQSLEEAFTFIPGEFTIKLLVDTAETFGLTAKRSRREEEATAYLTELGVPFEVRHLTVGDFVWVCQDGTSKELLLPYIVERKRSDDLAKSIKDGRFREQKFRLKQLPISERIYLVEELKKKDNRGIPFSTLMQAATNTQVVDGFKVKFTSNLKHSMQYLATMTEFLSKTFSKKILMSCPKDELPPFNIKDDLARLMTFKDFSRDTGKKRKYTVGEMFLKHLLQLRGMSVEKAKALVGLYPSPAHLMEAFRDNSAAKNRMMLAKLKIGPLGRSLGPVLSGVIHDFYTKNNFD